MQSNSSAAGLINKICPILLCGGWLFLSLCLLSYDFQDPPHPIGKVNQPVANWIGIVGAYVAYGLYTTFGSSSWLIVFVPLFYLYLKYFRAHTNKDLLVRTISWLIFVTMIATLQRTCYISWRFFPCNHPNAGAMPYLPGGMIATWLTDQLIIRFNTIGTFLITLCMAVICLIIAADTYLNQLLKFSHHRIPWAHLFTAINQFAQSLRQHCLSRFKKYSVFTAKAQASNNSKTISSQPSPLTQPKLKPTPNKKPSAQPTPVEEPAKKPEKIDMVALKEKMAKLKINTYNTAPAHENKTTLRVEQDLSGYQFPTLDLLAENELFDKSEQESLIRQQAENLENALNTYGIEGEVVSISSGPTVSLFDIALSPGVRAAKITNLSSDLARALKTSSIRVVANQMGKDTVGIEIPNSNREKVNLRGLMTATENIDQFILPMFLGKDSEGKILVEDLAAAPHLLIAGTTGSGKSVCMNSILLSLLLLKRPDELKLILVDPKEVEMAMFKKIPHLLCPVVTEMSKAAAILEWTCNKMDERFKQFKEAGVKNIAGYNQLTEEQLKERLQLANEEQWQRTPKKFPYLVFVIDELADLMMTNKEAEGFIVRIAQKARAAGIHLIIATQRPSANVVTGLIKANMPAKICMKVNSKIDSRIMMDQSGGELLLGHGDMLYLSSKSPELTRAQGCLITDQEVRNVCKHLCQVAKPSFELNLEQIGQQQKKAMPLLSVTHCLIKPWISLLKCKRAAYHYYNEDFQLAMDAQAASLSKLLMQAS